MRKRYLIDKKFQTRFALEMVLFVIVVPFLVWVNIVALGLYALDAQDYIEANKSAGGLLMLVFTKQWVLMTGIYIANVGIIYLLIVFHSHRIAGPVYRFTDALKRIAGGDLTQHVRLRNNDFLKDLGVEINRTAHAQNQTLLELSQAVRALKQANQHANNTVIAKEVDVLESIIGRHRLQQTETR